MRALIVLLLVSCSTLVDDAAARDVCLGTPLQCEQTRFVRAWWALHVLGYDDREPLRVEYDEGMRGDGVTLSPDAIVVRTARAVCHELAHVTLWRVTGDGCARHSEACLWGSAAEAITLECKAALAEVPDA
jgi:hypothetical protein